MTLLMRIHGSQGESPQKHLAEVRSELAALREQRPKRFMQNCCGELQEITVTPSWYQGRVAKHHPEALRVSLAEDGAVEVHTDDA